MEKPVKSNKYINNIAVGANKYDNNTFKISNIQYKFLN